MYVVATPIGNRKDITLRALDVLKEVDLIAAEDTRFTGRFLAAYDIKRPFISYHEHNEDKRTPELIERMKNGESIALLSDAGTPSVSDPGYRLIKAAIAQEIPVIPIPGASAAVAALSVSGLPTDAFLFVGFPARGKGKRLKFLKMLANEARTIVFYESPKRIIPLMEEMVEAMGDRCAVLAREMTKIHEEFLRGRLTEIITCMKNRSAVKGEITLLLAGRETEELPLAIIQRELKKRLDTDAGRVKQAVKEISDKYGVRRNKVYETAMKLREDNWVIKK